MKVSLTKEDFAAHDKATLRGAIEGISAGLAISLPLSYLANRRWATYRSFPISLKALGVILIVGPCYSIGAEQRGVQFDKSQWNDAGKATIATEENMRESKWEAMTLKQKVHDWSSRNQYKIILGSWVLSMGVAGTIIMRDKYQTSSQKIVQARMYAQGLTIGIMIAAGILTQTQRKEAAAHPHGVVDHSWAILLAEQEKQKQQERAEASSAA